MHKSWWFSKYKLYDKPFKAACSGIYSESLDGMPLILILVQNDSTTPPPRKLLPKFEEYFSLSQMATSKL